jgi:hypothetical protein
VGDETLLMASGDGAEQSERAEREAKTDQQLALASCQAELVEAR